MSDITLKQVKKVEELLKKQLSLRDIAGIVGISHESVRTIKGRVVDNSLDNK